MVRPFAGPTVRAVDAGTTQGGRLYVVLEIVAPVIGILLLGYVAARVGWFGRDAADGLGKFVFNFAIPCFLFRIFATRELPDAIPWDLFGGYYLPLISVYILAAVLGRRVFGRDWMGAIMTGFTASFGNTVLLGVPLVLRAFGEEGAIPVFLIISLHGLTLMTATTIFLEVAKSGQSAAVASPGAIALQALRGVSRNPLIGGLALGLAFNFGGVPVPKLADDFLALMQGAVVPCALFAMGTSLAQYGFRGRLGQSLTLVALKCVLFPGLVFAATALIFELPPVWTAVAVLIAAMPSGVNAYLFANRYGSGEAMASTSIVLSTVFSIFSIPAVLYYYNVTL